MIAGEIYKSFLETVIQGGVFSEEERAFTRALSENEKKDLASGKRAIDGRPPRLVRISGKGGWTPDAEAFGKRAGFMNVTLLDHLASVTRGAVVFAEIDLRASGLTEEARLRARLAMIAAVAFLHDADKMLDQSRSFEVTDEQVGFWRSATGS